MGYKGDKYYIEKVLHGDQKAFAFLVNQYKDVSFTLAKRLVKNDMDAEEVLQDSFIKVYTSLSSFKHEAKFSSWLYRIVYNTGISFIRKKNYDISSFEDSNIDPSDLSEFNHGFVNLSKKEQSYFIKNAIEKLKPDDSFILTLYYYEDKNTIEIAKITGLSESNIRIKMHRARKSLQKKLEEVLNKEADLRINV